VGERRKAGWRKGRSRISNIKTARDLQNLPIPRIPIDPQDEGI
jgi:hypothetical protein